MRWPDLISPDLTSCHVRSCTVISSMCRGWWGVRLRGGCEYSDCIRGKEHTWDIFGKMLTNGP